MELNFKLNELEVNIGDEGIEFSKTISDIELVEVIRSLKYHIDYLKLYRTGFKMGKNSVLSHVDENGYYTNHNVTYFGFDDSDI